MLITLFIFEILLMILTTFTTSMVEHKFKDIEQSLKMYTNNKAYTTETRIAFIEKVVNRYKACVEGTEEMPDIDSIVKSCLAKEYIGKFPYVSVKNIATKVKRVMWGIILLEILIAIVNGQGATLSTVVITSASAFLTISMEFYTIIRGLNEHSENLIAEVSDYVINIYPVQKKRIQNKDIREIKIVDNKVITLDKAGKRTETKLTSEQKEKLKDLTQEKQKMGQEENKKEETTLSAQDIAQLLGIL
nr:hypothetical protein [uncultured Cellulosilyticum sp.]